LTFLPSHFFLFIFLPLHTFPFLKSVSFVAFLSSFLSSFSYSRFTFYFLFLSCFLYLFLSSFHVTILSSSLYFCPFYSLGLFSSLRSAYKTRCVRPFVRTKQANRCLGLHRASCAEVIWWIGWWI
jgi:hypothetical protein